MKIQGCRAKLLASLMVLTFVVRLSLAIAFANPMTFWINVGFMLCGTSLGVGAAIWMIKGLFDESQTVEKDRSKRILLKSLGHDGIGAIDRIFGPVGSFSFRFKGENLNDACYFGVETGQLSPVGFQSNLNSEFDHVSYGPPSDPRRIGNPAATFPLLHDTGIDFDLGLMMLSRALGSAYARSDLFEVNELPTGDLESARILLRDGKSNGVLDSFESAMLISPLEYAVEKSGTLLWELGGFVESRSRF